MSRLDLLYLGQGGQIRRQGPLQPVARCLDRGRPPPSPGHRHDFLGARASARSSAAFLSSVKMAESRAALSATHFSSSGQMIAPPVRLARPK
eukprot:3592260-Pyramimonas_sp.AAC.1